MTDSEDEDVILKILHTADWHLGMRFASFDQPDRQRLTRARMEAVRSIFALADRYDVDAVLCAGDIFDDPQPDPEWHETLSKFFRDLHNKTRPVVLLPGNHDPLMTNSVYDKGHAFRRALPAWVQVVDTDDYALELGTDAVVYAMPCRSRAGDRDLALALPSREAGDERIRIGLVHGQTFDIEGHETNFPIASNAGEQRGMNYLALGDTHGFRILGSDKHPMVYPGTPEQTRFGEQEAGSIAIVCFTKRRRPHIHRERIGAWSWRDTVCESIAELTSLASEGLRETVLRLELRMTLPLDEYDEARRTVEKLRGTEAAHGLAGILIANDSELRVDVSRELAFLDDLPPVLQEVAQRLQADAGEPEVERALYHLYTLARQVTP